MRKLVREPVTKHPWRFHRWSLVGLAGAFSMAYQCDRCNLVQVDDVLLDSRQYGDHTILLGGERYD